jgi:hypothetical protein
MCTQNDDASIAIGSNMLWPNQATADFDGIMLDNMDAPWSSSQPYHQDGLQEMFIPAAKMVRDKGLGVWANGPHISKDGHVEANASQWKPYLDLATFTTLFEMPLTTWLNYPTPVSWAFLQL